MLIQVQSSIQDDYRVLSRQTSICKLAPLAANVVACDTTCWNVAPANDLISSRNTMSPSQAIDYLHISTVGTHE